MKIAFIDHHLDNFHAATFHRLLAAREGAPVEIIAWESDPTSPDWCERHGVARASTMLEAAQAADAILALGPDAIDQHARWAPELLALGKPVVFDKALSYDVAEAETIARLAVEHGTPIFAASALRYAVEAEDLIEEIGDARVKEVFARGYGSWWHYGIHTVALAERFTGPITEAMDAGTPDSRQLAVRWDAGFGTIDCREGFDAGGWTLGVRADGTWHHRRVEDHDGFYANVLERYLAFFATGEAELTPADLVATVRLLNASDACQASGQPVVIAR